MGIDIYMHWDGQEEEEREEQLKGFVMTSGDVGYLRESYHGKIYATRVLVPEAFEHDLAHDCYDTATGKETGKKCSACFGVRIPAQLLRERLERTGQEIIKRYQETYQCEPTSPETLAQLRTFGDFVKLAERKERETGKPVGIYASY